MDEQFDNKLTNHIREVFDNYDHPGAEHGWAQLKKSLPVKQERKTAWLWWSSAAAVILVFVGLGIWYSNQGAAVDNIAVKPAAKQQQPLDIKDSTVNKANAPVIKEVPVLAKTNTPAFAKPAGSLHPVNSNTAPVNPIPSTAITMQPTEHVLPSNISPADQPLQAAIVPAVTDSVKATNDRTTPPQMAATQNPAVNNTTQLAAVATPDKTTAPSVKKTMADMFNEDQRQQLAKQNKAGQDKQDSKKVNFSVYAATYFNYAEGSSNQINAGAGITSDFRLSKNLKLSTGIALAQNSLSYNTSAPQASNAVFAAAPPLKQQSLFGAAALVPVFKNYNASLVGLDIPINIKYEFNPQKSDAYISAGLSSGTFIDESYTYRYGYSNGTSANAGTQTERTAHNSFNSFYFGKTLNFSFGVGYPVGTNRLIVEPFVKYPLGGLGAQDIRFGAGGVNLKFSFKGKR